MSAKPWIALVGNREVDRAFTLGVAKSLCVLKSPRGCELSIHMVRHEWTGEEHIGHKDKTGMWHWTKVGAPPVPTEDVVDEPPRRRWRADIDG